jgi:hypothetical protein
MSDRDDDKATNPCPGCGKPHFDIIGHYVKCDCGWVFKIRFPNFITEV